MTSFVFVGGFWIGAWAWRDVERELTALGHKAYPVTLTGLAERAHLASREVRLATHVEDVVAFITVEDLHDVVLVGHSGGSAVIDGVADRVPERLAGLVYVDTGPLAEGTSVLDFSSPEERAKIETRVKDEGEGWRLPLPSWDDLGAGNLVGLSEMDLARFRERAVAHPYRAAADPVRRTHGEPVGLRKWAIMCTLPITQLRGMIAEGVPGFAVMGGPDWTLLDLSTGHWPMWSEPARLAAMLAAWPDADQAILSARRAS